MNSASHFGSPAPASKSTASMRYGSAAVLFEDWKFTYDWNISLSKAAESPRFKASTAAFAFSSPTAQLRYSGPESVSAPA